MTDYYSRRWTRETVIAAVQKWADEHGGKPPVVNDWRPTATRAAGYPSPGTVASFRKGERVGLFDFWGDAIEAAGFPRPPDKHALSGHGANSRSNVLGKRHEREGGGMIVTFGCEKERRTEIYVGMQRACAAQAVTDCRAFGDGWKILAICTPRSIYSDLQGREKGYTGEASVIPRRHHDLLAPNLIGQFDESVRKRRAVGLR